MNLGKMMKQAQELQSKMAEMQERLAEAEVEGSSGAGMVTAVLNGKNELKRLKIDPSLVDPADVEVLEDLIVAAVNDARTRVEQHVKEEMSKVTGGLNLPPGMNLPF
jgi:hypothetical protein